MKKLLILAIICASLFALVSCADIDATASESTNTTSVQTTAPAQDLLEKKEYYENGNLKAITVYDNDGEMISVTEFNENKYVQIKKTVYQNGKILYISEYDENGALKEKTEFDENGNKTSHTAYSDYNEINLPSHIENTDIESGTKTVTKYKKDGKTLTETLVYNQNGLLTSLQKYKSNGDPSDKLLYYYDKNGLNIRTENVSSDGSLLRYALIEYYPSGKTRSASSYYSDGTNHYRIDYYETGEDLREYIYHQKGVIWRIIEYSKSGNIIRNQDYENGILRVDTSFKDSSSVICEKVTLYNTDGSLKEYTIYEESQTITYYPDGTPKQ
jgi:antitoxin component YwqK of YwqJK toxin-antitoxin module